MKQILKLLLVSLLATLAVQVMEAQTCKELFRKANNQRLAEKYDESIATFQRVKNCNDKSYVKDCDYWIKWIKDNRPDNKEKRTKEFSLSTSDVTIPYQGGEYTVKVYGVKSWDFVVDGDWCVVKKSGNSLVIASKDENTELRQRLANIQVSSGSHYKVINIVNEGAPEVLRSSVNSLSFPASGETDVVDIIANTNWKITDVPTWVTASKSNSNIKFTATANNQNVERQANVKVLSPSNSEVIIRIYQSAGDEKLSFSKNEIEFGPNGGDEYIRVYTDAPDWKFGDFPHWCQVSRIGKDSIHIHCTPNEPINESREASVNVTTGMQTLGINISQEAKPIIAYIPSLGIGGRSVSFGISAGMIFPMVSASAGGNFTGSAVNYALGNNDESASYSSSTGFSLGAFADIRIYKNIYLIAGANYTHYSYKNDFDANVDRRISQNANYYLAGTTQNNYTEEYTMNMLEIPILLSYRLPVSKISHVQINFGPVVNFGLSAKMKLSGSTDSETLYAYQIVNHQQTNVRYDPNRYSTHYTGNGELDLYGKNVSFYETYAESNNAQLSKSQSLDDSPYSKLNFGLRIGAAYEYSGISIAIEYTFMLNNMANKKYWEGDRWKVFDQTTNTLMSGYKQRNHYLGVKLGYTFRY